MLRLALLFLSLLFLPVRAEVLKSTAPTYFLMDAETGLTLAEKNPDQIIAPGNMTKLMSLLMVFEAIEQATLNLRQPIRIGENAWRKGGAPSGSTTMFASVNSDVSVDDLISGMIVQSANEASIALAEAISGNENDFAKAMTMRAHALGLRQSQFKNATGLPEAGHVMRLRELGLLGEYILREFPQYSARFQRPRFAWNGIDQLNRNSLLNKVSGLEGLTTGQSEADGYGMVAAASRNGKRLILVISGLQDAQSRDREASQILNWGFAQFRHYEPIKAGQEMGRAQIWAGKANKVAILAKNDVKFELYEREKALLRIKIRYQSPLRAPIWAGQEIGQVEAYVGDRLLGKSALITATAVDETPEMWRKALSSLRIHLFGG